MLCLCTILFCDTRYSGRGNKQGKSGYVETCCDQTTTEKAGRTREVGVTITSCFGGGNAVVPNTGEKE